MAASRPSWTDPSQIVHTDTFNDCLQVSYSLCIQIMIMGHTNYEIPDFQQFSNERWPPVGHLGSDQFQILHTEYIMKIPKNSAETNARATFRRFR